MRVNPFLQLRQVRFVGPSHVGKTTALLALTHQVRYEPSAVTVVGDEVRAVSEVGEWTAPNGAVVSVVTASELPVHVSRHSGSLPRAAATVLWVDGSDRAGYAQARRWVDLLAGHRSTGTLTVAINHAVGDSPVVRDITTLVRCHDATIPVLLADARSGVAVVAVLEAALRDPLALPRTA